MKRPPRDPVKDKLVNERYRETVEELSKTQAASLLILEARQSMCLRNKLIA